ncbi:hypothetical protein EVAR_21431_1 [Eumeta japonica]|uniref:Uncharacterized protein n=1 Tax=Eumeta variegata TaxID=151549 RepID=A0A4C1VG75_EUMVA|nr:hypothetical protein EVAR_21431_1 [Eumeta japonica]
MLRVRVAATARPRSPAAACPTRRCRSSIYFERFQRHYTRHAFAERPARERPLQNPLVHSRRVSHKTPQPPKEAFEIALNAAVRNL